MSDVTGHPQFHASPPDKAFIRIRRPAPELMVEVRRIEPPVEFIAQPCQRREEHHGIQPARHRDQQLRPRGQQPFFTDDPGQSRQEGIHARELTGTGSRRQLG